MAILIGKSKPQPKDGKPTSHRATAQTRPENRARNIPGVGGKKK